MVTGSVCGKVVSGQWAGGSVVNGFNKTLRIYVGFIINVTSLWSRHGKHTSDEFFISGSCSSMVLLLGFFYLKKLRRIPLKVDFQQLCIF